MNRRAKQDLVFSAVAAALLGMSCIGPASAYIDPGTGSYVLQMAAAGVLAGLLVIKAFWGNLKGFVFRVLLRRQNNDS